MKKLVNKLKFYLIEVSNIGQISWGRGKEYNSGEECREAAIHHLNTVKRTRTRLNKGHTTMMVFHSPEAQLSLFPRITHIVKIVCQCNILFFACCETEVMIEILRGRSQEEIATSRGITMIQLKTIVEGICKKMEVDTFFECKCSMEEIIDCAA